MVSPASVAVLMSPKPSVGAAADLSIVSAGAGAIGVVIVASIVGNAGAPVGTVPDTFTVFSTSPASTSACVTAIEVQLKVNVSAKDKRLLASSSPPNKIGALAHLGSSTTILPILTLPLLIT